MTENATDATDARNSIRLLRVLVIILAIGLFFFVAISAAIGIALGFGFCLSTLIPAIELPLATIIASLAQLVVLTFFLKILTAVFATQIDLDLFDQREEPDVDDFAENVADRMIDALVEKTTAYEPNPVTVVTKRRARRKVARTR